ncbi:MAG TPA: sortase [Actinomycetota bacterium]|jgi:sortase A|nr:sortase [Actinomycetota bacterium]
MDSASADPAGAWPRRGSPPRRRRRGRILFAIGAALIAASLAIGSYLGWQLWGTGLATQRWQSQLRKGFEKQIDTQVATPTAGSADPRVVLPGQAVAILQIPRIGLDMVVVEGTGIEDLKKGPGHYTDTAYPWQDHGRVGIAGHRTTYLHPFFHLDQVRPGDRIILQTRYGTYDYEVTRVFVTLPDDGSVLEQTRRPTLVLTTCEPRYSASHRLIVDAVRT